MREIKTINEMKNMVCQWRNEGLTIGVVPTMGYLHNGHLSLVNASTKDNDKTIVTIFVNPKQFGEDEDLDVYPRDEKGDLKVCLEHNVDAVFMPTVDEMYPVGFDSFVNVNGVSDGMVGESRPGHFQGVCTVVTKLFNITSPDRAYFGQKDAQQLAVIKKMVMDLNMNLEIIGCPTVREADGLAMSSRNSYLNENERSRASGIFKALMKGHNQYKSGETSPVDIKKVIEDAVYKICTVRVQYIEIVDPIMMDPVEKVHKGDMCLIAVTIGKTLLIDNIIF